MANVWQSPAQKPLRLSIDEVHVWRADLNLMADSKAYKQLLTSDENARAQRLRSPSDQQHFIAARAVLRLLLAIYLSAKPNTLQFSYGQYGKPELAIQHNPLSLQFNLTHSNGLAAYALTLQHAVGIDVEYRRSNLAFQAIAQRFFKPAELQQILQLPHQEQRQAFYTFWTAKEALVKVLGKSLFVNQNAFCLGLSSAETIQLLPTGSITNWFLQSFSIGPGFSACLACNHAVSQVHYYDFLASNTC